MFTKLFLITLLSLIPGLSVNDLKSDFAAPTFKIKSDFPKLRTDSMGVKLDSKGAIILDVKTKKVLFEKNAYKKMPPASLTKIMTALLALDSKKLDEPTKISKKSQGMIERTIGLEEGEVVTLKDLFIASLVASGNDTAEALAEGVAGGDLKRFADQMNEKAKKMGLSATHFENPTGLDHDNQFSSAYDLAILFLEAIKNPVFRETMTKKEYEIKTITPDKKYKFATTNRLLKDNYPNIVGGKTGFTDKAGFCFVNLAQNKDGNQIITVTLGAKLDGQQFQDTKALIEWAYKNYRWKE